MLQQGGYRDSTWFVQSNGVYQVTVTDSNTGCQITLFDTITTLPCNIRDTITYTYLGNGLYHFTGSTNMAHNIYWIVYGNSGLSFLGSFTDTLSFYFTLTPGIKTIVFGSGSPVCCCNNEDSIIIYVPNYSACNMTLTDSVANPTCSGNNGQVRIFASGGVAPYSYKQGINSLWQSGNTFSGLTYGVDSFYVKDSTGCTKSIVAILGTTVYDTSHIVIYDTVRVNVFDTIYTSIAVTDTLYITVHLTGIGFNNNNELLVYPNPAKTYLVINCGNYSIMSGYSITITNTLGQNVFITSVNQQIYNLNLSTWTGQGVYLMKIYDQGGQLVSIKEIVLQ
jgi:Secretion system C-terminal sorting domain/SprB repeat